MPQIEPISDAADPRVDVYRDQKDAWLRAAHHPGGDGTSGTGYSGGLFMAEGELVLDHLLASEYEPESLLITPARWEGLNADTRGAVEALPGSVPIYLAEREVMAEVCGFDIHRGVLAAARRGPDRDPQDVARSARTLVVLEDLTNHDNVGSIFRSAAAISGIDRVGVLLSPRCCDPLYRKSIRVSMGLALRVPFATLVDWPAGLRELSALGYETWALTPGADAEDITVARAVPRRRVALLVGSEGPGLTDAAIRASDRRVRIPIAPGVDSLNAGVSAAIALHRVETGGRNGPERVE
ncbi:MAG: RNA methyltransferase [Phycisphaerales bacterium]